jgi:L-lactate dehydrogenase complex protein LldG
MTASCIEQFTRRFESLRGQTCVVPDALAAAQAVADICVSAEAAKVAFALLDGALETEMAERCERHGIQVIRPPYAHGELPAALDSVNVGVTGAAFGIAQSGTLVEVCTDDSHRLVSALPRTYIGVVRASSLVERFFDAAPRLREIIASHERGCTVSFISGPSRTGDIEMILTLGVHGPEAAYAVVVDDIGGARA